MGFLEYYEHHDVLYRGVCPFKTLFHKIKNRTENAKKGVHHLPGLAGFLGPVSPSPSRSPRWHDTQYWRLALQMHIPNMVAEDRGTEQRGGRSRGGGALARSGRHGDARGERREAMATSMCGPGCRGNVGTRWVVEGEGRCQDISMPHANSG